MARKGLTEPEGCVLVHIMPAARIIAHGRSQGVRRPKAFRFDADVVAGHREGVAVVLEPIGKSVWPKDFWERVRIRDKTFTRAPEG